MNQNDDEIQQRLCNLLGEQVDSLDGANLSRLRQARARAVEHNRKKSGWLKAWLVTAPSATRWSGFAGLAVIALFSVNILFFMDHSDDIYPPDVGTSLMFQDMEEQSLTSLDIADLGDDMELLDDLDFYRWLEGLDGPNDMPALDPEAGDSKA